MSYKPVYITSFEADSGLDLYHAPFMVADKAFPVLEDAYAWRGRIVRRQGFENLGRLRRCFTVAVTLSTQANGAAYNNADILADASINVRATQTNAEIETGSLAITVGAVTFTDDGDGNLTGVPGTNSGTINYITGQLDLTFNPPLGGATNVDVTFCYFPALPVMGLPTREIPLINDEQTVAFDTRFAYRFVGGQWEELPSTAATTWSGSDSDFFWATNFYQNAAGDIFWVTNFSGTTGDPIRYYDGTTWTNFTPAINAASFLNQSLILIPYKDRLLAMNTYEGANLAGSINFPQRVRFSQNGDPTDQVNGWLETVAGRGGFIDIPTNEAIISAFFIKDALLIKCERSSWKVIYTGNELLPFVFQKINAELGCESTFSMVPFDRGVLAIGNYGITTDDSVNVTRIDEIIPDIVFQFENENNGVKRVHGIRDFTNQLALWSYPSSETNPTYPDRVLVYNYVNNTYAIFNDRFTAFGYFQKAGDTTWATLPYGSWTEWNDPWNSGILQAKYPLVCAGNQQGYVSLLDQQQFNEQSLAITAVGATTITVPNHNLQPGMFIKVIGSIGITGLNDVIYKISSISGNILTLQDSSGTPSFTGTYLGGGEVIVLNNIKIRSKRFSPYFEVGSQVRIGFMDFFLDRTTNGEFTLNIFIDENSSLPINDPSSFSNDGLLGQNVVLTRPENTTIIPFQSNQDRIWHRTFIYSVAQNFQFEITFDDEQMFSEDINSSIIIMHALVLYISENARLVQ